MIYLGADATPPGQLAHESLKLIQRYLTISCLDPDTSSASFRGHQRLPLFLRRAEYVLCAMKPAGPSVMNVVQGRNDHDPLGRCCGGTRALKAP
jgi:hypothetical protein